MHLETACDEKMFSFKEFLDEEWRKLNSGEKALAMNYKRQLKSGAKVSPLLINAFSDLCEKYPDFCVACVP